MKIVFSAFLFLLPVFLHSQTNTWLSSEAQLCLSQEYLYDLSDMGSITEDETYYISAYRCFLQFIKNEDKEQIKCFEKEKNRLLKVAKINNLKTTMMLINLDVQLGLMQVMNGDEMTGVYGIYRAYKTFSSLDKKKCNELEYQKLNALFLILADQVQAQNNFFSWLLGIEGDEAMGFQLLRSYLNQTKYQDGLHKEGLLLFAYCSLQFSDIDRTELKWLQEETAQYESPLLSFVMVLNAFKINETNLLFEWVNNCEEDKIQQFPLLGYVKGRLLLNQLNNEGIVYLEQFVTNEKGNSYKGDALFRMARFYHVKEDSTRRDVKLSLLNALKKLPTSLDKQAKTESIYLKERPEPLAKARFLFDGGDYLTAISVLNTDSINNYPSFFKAEWWYRKARAEHLLGNWKEALIAYDKVIAVSSNDTRYYGPYSALFAFDIYQKQNDNMKATDYLNKASELNTGEYKKEINLRIEKSKDELN